MKKRIKLSDLTPIAPQFLVICHDEEDGLDVRRLGSIEEVKKFIEKCADNAVYSDDDQPADEIMPTFQVYSILGTVEELSVNVKVMKNPTIEVTIEPKKG